METVKRNFEVYLQPKIVIETGKLQGAEALIRCYEDGNLLMPDDFLPSLEEKDLISMIDLFVFEEVCKWLKEWQHESIGLLFSLNFSRKSLLNPSIVREIEKIRELYGINRRQLEIEITETMACTDEKRLKETINDIHEKGYLLSLDDYGSGYNNLQFLAQVPFETLKIDRLLTNELLSNEKMRSIIENIIELSHQMGIKVVAEGIETIEQRDTLKEMRCDFGQGYYYEKPISMTRFEEMYMNERGVI